MVDERFFDTNLTLITLNCEHVEPLSALDFSAFFYDVNVLFAIAVKALDASGKPASLGSSGMWSYRRNNFRLSASEQLRIRRVRFESPSLVELTTAAASAAGALWLFAQALEKLILLPHTAQKLKLEIRKLEREVGRALPQSRERREPYLETAVVKTAIRQLSENPIKPTDISIRIGRRENR